MATLIRRRVLNFLWPETCAHCREDLSKEERGSLCARCRLGIVPLESPFCLRCADIGTFSKGLCPACRKASFSCRLIRAALVYRGPVASWVHAFKYRGRFPAAREAGRLMARHWTRFPELGGVDALVPVPLHLRRARFRGYNQAKILAAEIGRERGIPVLEPLARVKSTKPQWSLDRNRRRENIRGAFKVERAGDVFGKRLILIDDVCTTGYSIEECAAALLKAGALSVRAYALAREA